MIYYSSFQRHLNIHQAIIFNVLYTQFFQHQTNIYQAIVLTFKAFIAYKAWSIFEINVVLLWTFQIIHAILSNSTTELESSLIRPRIELLK